jgi:hypothetical protein
MGFSAGGHLAALSTNFKYPTYERAGQSDAVSCRPDFCLLICAASLTVKEEGDKASP